MFFQLKIKSAFKAYPLTPSYTFVDTFLVKKLIQFLCLPNKGKLFVCISDKLIFAAPITTMTAFALIAFATFHLFLVSNALLLNFALISNYVFNKKV